MNNKTVNPIELIEESFSEYYKKGGIRFRVSEQNYILVKACSILLEDFTDKFIEEIGAIYEDIGRYQEKNLRFNIGTEVNSGKSISYLLKEKDCDIDGKITELDKEIDELWRNERNGCAFFIPRIGLMGQATFVDNHDDKWKAIPIELKNAIHTVINNVVKRMNEKLLELERSGVVLKAEETTEKHTDMSEE